MKFHFIYTLILLLLPFNLLLSANVKVIDTAGCNLAISSQTDNNIELKSTSFTGTNAYSK